MIHHSASLCIFSARLQLFQVIGDKPFRSFLNPPKKSPLLNGLKVFHLIVLDKLDAIQQWV